MSDLTVEKNASSIPEQAGGLPEVSSFPDPFRDYSETALNDSVIDIVETNEPFFMGGDRRAVLDEAIHLCQFSNNLVAVLGEAGVGKTALVRQLLRELNETAQCCLVRSSVMSSALDVFQSIAQQVGAFLPETSTVEQVIDVLAQYQPAGSQQRIIVLVDDAHHLHDEVLSSFIALLQGQSIFNIHILLVGDSSLLQRLDYLDKGDVLVYDIPLCPFNTLELEEYLSFRLEAVGYQGIELFDVNTVQRVWDETRGIPASVNRYASNLLLAQRLDDGSRSGLPMHYMALLVLILAALILSLFYLGGDEHPDESTLPSPVEQQQPLSQTVAPKIEESVSEKAPEVMGVGGVGNIENVEGAVLQLPVEKPDEDATVQNAEEFVIEEVVIEEVVVERPVERPVEKVVEDRVTVPSVQSAPVKIETANTEVPGVDVPEVSAGSEKQLFRATRDEEVVLFWPDDKYTLQIIAAGQLDSIQRFVDKQPNRELLRIVRFERQSKPWYVVLVGIYSSVAEARAAIATLPGEQVKSKPWPRKIDDVKTKIRDFSDN